MTARAREWFRIQNSVDDPSVADIHIIDIIGDWIDELINEFYGVTATITAKAFVDQLAKLPDAVKTIKVHINSPGGDVFAALNIANALRAQQTAKGRTVETIVDGLAASAASIVMMAGSKVTVADNALVMVHNPWSVSVGNAADMRKTADTLDTIRNTIVATYQWHSSLKADDLIALLDAETWMSADEAIANGFATAKVEGIAAAASIDPTSVAKMKVPDKFKARVESLLKQPTPAPAAASAAEILGAVKNAGLDIGFAEQLVAAALPMDQVMARITAEKSAQAAKTARASEIRGLCATAKLPTLADGYINGAMSIGDVRAHLTTVTAAMHRAEIDTGLTPENGGGGPKPAIDTAAIYAARNKAQVN
jgi:ATP-dependent protease ClpP protease subunit